jgi:hypothetical protein
MFFSGNYKWSEDKNLIYENVFLFLFHVIICYREHLKREYKKMNK